MNISKQQVKAAARAIERSPADHAHAYLQALAALRAAFPDAVIDGMDPNRIPAPPTSAAPQPPKPATLDRLVAEILRARTKFPGNALLLAALTEEVGELAQALLQRQGPERVTAEALQVATVALRIAEEGDATFANLTDAQALA